MELPYDVQAQLSRYAQEMVNVALEQLRPCMLWKPSLGRDGNQWSALYGDNIQEGVCGFGDSPDEAMRDFDKEWYKKVVDK